MGNLPSSQPKNKIGKKVVTQKLTNAGKTGVLSLREHHLDTIPVEMFELTNLTTIDLSANKLSNLGPIYKLSQTLKSLRLCENQFQPGSLEDITKLSKLQNLAAANNALGKPSSPQSPSKQHHGPQKTTTTPSVPPEKSIPVLPESMKQIKLDHNFYTDVPSQLFAKHLTNLVTLDLGSNLLVSIPSAIANLTSLRSLFLDNNQLTSLPKEMGQLHKLKTLGLKHNHISHEGRIHSETNPQPLPRGIFAETSLIDLNLHGNPLKYTTLEEFDGFDVFLERRKGVKSKGLSGGAMTDMDVCGLK